MEIDPLLPEIVLLDEVRLRQILFNLLGNAIKFTEKGYVKLSVTIDGYSHSNTLNLIFSVEDTGIGIEEDEKELIFKEFRQKKGQSNIKYGGTGLGLTLTRRLVDLMNGEISVESEVGQGAKFTCKLWRVNILSQTEMHKLNLFSGQEHIRTFGEILIIIVDNIKEDREVIKDFLEHYNVNILEAENGEEAIEMVAEYRPDLIVMDMKIPGRSWYKTIRAFKENEYTKDIPVVSTTGSIIEEDKSLAIRAGCVALLNKPVNKEDLLTDLSIFLPHLSQKEKKDDRKKEEELFSTSITPEIRGRVSEMLELLEHDLMDRWNNVQKSFIIDEIEDFATEIKKLAFSYNIDILEEWGNKILREVNTFDIEELTKTLYDFPELIGIREIKRE